MTIIGVAAAIPPTFPIRRSTPFIVANSFMRNHVDRIFNPGIVTTAAPMPITNFPTIIRSKSRTSAE